MTTDASTVSTLQNQQRALHAALASLDSLVVAYSGGVDSAFLAWAAHQALGSKMLAVIADSPSLPRRELRQAIQFAQQFAIPLQVVATGEMERPEYTRNDSRRCFHCKDELFDLLEALRQELNFRHIAYGRNLDDDSDFRPGQAAAELHHVVAPLADAGLDKSAVRELARQAGLPLWDKPAAACLSSRVEPGRPVTREILAQIEAGEAALHNLGFEQVRVRHHGEIARIEFSQADFSRAFTPEMARTIVPVFKQLGFRFVTLDCEGYRSGSMNSLVSLEQMLGSTDIEVPRKR